MVIEIGELVPCSRCGGASRLMSDYGDCGVCHGCGLLVLRNGKQHMGNAMGIAMAALDAGESAWCIDGETMYVGGLAVSVVGCTPFRQQQIRHSGRYAGSQRCMVVAGDPRGE